MFNLMLAIGRCYNGLDISEREANNNPRVIGRRKKTPCIAPFPCDSTALVN